MADATLPTEDEIRRLSRWAQVAFAARCARRVQPLFLKHWPDSPWEYSDEIEKAIRVAENISSSSHSYVHNMMCEDTTDSIVDVADVADNYSSIFAAYAARSAETAAYSAETAAYSAETAAHSAKALATSGMEAVSQIRADFDLLLKLSQQEGWTDDTPVPPTVFPPLDAPLPQPEKLDTSPSDDLEADENIRIKVRFLGKPGITAEELAPHIQATYKALNEYTLAKYGKYLKLADFKRLVLKYAGVPV